MFLVTTIIIIGLVLNVSFIIVIYKNKTTKEFQSTKPFRHLIIAILISDIWLLINKFDISSAFKINFYSYNGICQVSSYLNALFTVLLECHMLFGAYVLFRITFKKNSPEKLENESNYDQPRHVKVLDNDAQKQNQNDLDEIVCVQKQNISSSLYVKPTKKKFSLSAKMSSSLKANFKFDYWERVKTKKYRLEEVYYNLIIAEKHFITLNTIFWIYMLSFLIWIHGVKYSNTSNIEKDTDLLESQSFLRKAIFTKKIAKDLNESAPTEFRLIRKPMCMVYEFAQPIFRIYTTCTIYLRLFTLCVNILVSVLHHIKFRKEYFRSILEMFNNKISAESNLKRFSFSRFNLFYTTKRSYNQNLKFCSIKSTNKRGIQSHYEHIHFLRHYAKIIFLYSLLIAPSVLNEVFQTNLCVKQIKKPENQKKALLLLQLLDESFENSVEKEEVILGRLNKKILDFNLTSDNLFQVLNDFNKPKRASSCFHDEAWFKSLVYYSSLLSHSTKFIVYFMFTFHIKIFLKNVF